MGSLYSHGSSNAAENMANPTNSSSISDTESTRSILDLDPLTQDVEVFEAEFKRMKKLVKGVLDKLENTPCNAASSEVVACLRENSCKMGNCLSHMKTYRSCIDQATKNKLDRFIYEIKT